MAYDLDPSYKQVPERIADFKAKHPDGCLRLADPAVPYRIEHVGGKSFIVVVAAAYRTPDDPSPGIGMAWELVPGKTPYTKDSELQNAETSAWGRAIVAVLASESKAVASAEDVRNRRADHDAPDVPLAAGSVRQDIASRIAAIPEPAITELRSKWKEHRLPKPERLTEDHVDAAVALLDEFEVWENPDAHLEDPEPSLPGVGA